MKNNLQLMWEQCLFHPVIWFVVTRRAPSCVVYPAMQEYCNQCYEIIVKYLVKGNFASYLFGLCIYVFHGFG
jgi:hypothetical protein